MWLLFVCVRNACVFDVNCLICDQWSLFGVWCVMQICVRRVAFAVSCLLCVAWCLMVGLRVFVACAFVVCCLLFGRDCESGVRCVRFVCVRVV